MQSLFKCLFFVYFIIKLSISTSFSYAEISIMLIFAASIIIRDKYYNSITLVVFEILILTVGVMLSPYFAIFFGIICYDLVALKKPYGIVVVIPILLVYIKLEYALDLFLVIGICSLISYINLQNQMKSQLLETSFDKERKYSYELEMSKRKLILAAEETAHMIEIKERNRIAHELHDNIGHSVAGVLMILQASSKLINRDNEKSKELLDKAVASLSEALTLIKNTVYNIKPKDEFGINYINELIKAYTFCNIDFKYNGNFNDLTAGHMEIIITNIKEALTNASKYSQATLISIALDKNENFIRLMIKDNGVGCPNIKDSLGLSGIRDRIRNLGGSISISGDNGFTIVCIIPLKREVGEMFEGSVSR